jgi:hypothetical protein
VRHLKFAPLMPEVDNEGEKSPVSPLCKGDKIAPLTRRGVFLLGGFLLGVLLLLLSSCADIPETGKEGQKCFKAGFCLEGLACVENICVKIPDAGLTDGGSKDVYPDAISDAKPDVLTDVPIDTYDAGVETEIEAGVEPGTEELEDVLVSDVEGAEDIGEIGDADAGVGTEIGPDVGGVYSLPYSSTYAATGCVCSGGAYELESVTGWGASTLLEGGGYSIERGTFIAK